MEITVQNTQINDVKIIIPDQFKDTRGFFMEVFRKDIFKIHNLPNNFVQMNHSGSVKNVLRGLHFQWDPPMGKLMRVTRGKAYLVAVDIRKGSPTLGNYVGEIVSSENMKQVWAPPGFARGFCVLSEYAEIQYLCTGVYNSNYESGIFWNDKDIGIEWPVKNPIISPKDEQSSTLKEWLDTPESENFKYHGDK